MYADAPAGIAAHAPLAMVYSRDDAASLNASGVHHRATLAMTPNARAALHAAGARTLGASNVLDDRAHLRIVARSRRLDRAIARLLAGQPTLSRAASITFASELHFMAGSAVACWILLGPQGPWAVRDDAGRWVEHASRKDALRAVIAHIRRIDTPIRSWVRTPFAAPLARALNALAVRIAIRNRAVAIPDTSYGMADLVARLTRHRGNRVVELRGPSGTYRDLLHPFRTLLHAMLGKSVVTAIAVPKLDHHIRLALEAIWDAMPDETVRTGLAAYRDEILDEATLTHSLAHEMRQVLSASGVRTVLLNALRWGVDAALAEAGGDAGATRVLISHGSHTPQTTAPAMAEQRALADGLLVSPLADVAVTQSPHADALARDLMPGIQRRAFRPVMWGYKPLPDPANDGTRRHILHAGTYKRLVGMRAWIYEASNEFVQGLCRLIDAVAELDNAFLTIRIRPMPECDLDALAQLLPRSDCYRIKTDGSFLDDLANADLLVSYASTAIEEALNARRPVVLWGGSQRYQHLPPETAPPTPSRRAAIYAPAAPQALAKMLAAVLESHAHAPLSDEELATHVWPASTPDADDLAAMIAQGNVGA